MGTQEVEFCWNATSIQILNDMNELDEFLIKEYRSSTLYKENMKKHHVQNIEKNEFAPCDLVFLFNSRLRLIQGKLKSKWTGAVRVTLVFPHGMVELDNKEGTKLKVNGMRIKFSLGHVESVNEVI